MASIVHMGERLDLPAGFALVRAGTILEQIAGGGVVIRDDLVIADLVAMPRESVPGFSLYGGATITRARGGDGREIFVCDAKTPQNVFRLCAFWRIPPATALNYAELNPLTTGRGSVAEDPIDGLAHWTGWNESYFNIGTIPGSPPLDFGNGGAPIPPAGASYPIVYCNPAKSTPDINGQTFAGTRTIDLVAMFGIPGPIVFADVRFGINAATPGTRGRLGGDGDPWQLTPFAQAPNIDMSDRGNVYPPDGRHVQFSVKPDGASCIAWLNLIAYMLR